MVGLATGMALEGRVVFTYSIGNFSTLRCLEQIRNDAAYHDANVKVVAVGGGFSYGALGISHHATEDLAIMRSIPGVTVVAPGDGWEAEEATTAIAKTPGICYLRLDRSAAGIDGSPDSSFQLGKARTVVDGKDLTLVCAGGILAEGLTAARLLAEQGISLRVISMHTLKPLDSSALIRAASETGGIATLEEHTTHGGLGGAVAECLLDRGVWPRRFIRFGLRGCFSSIVGSQGYLRRIYGLDAGTVAEAILGLLTKRDGTCQQE
jgi:transketolase